MKYEHIIFDLDGTLIDSSISILDSFKKAFFKNKIKPKKTLDSSIIGPPLMEILSLLSGLNDEKKLLKLANDFKSYYDNSGYKNTLVFPGIEEMLLNLKQNKFKLYIATNKRINPTIKIINLLNWSEIFEGVYSLDSFSPSLPSKAEVLNQVIDNNEEIYLKESIYIGDRDEDRYAARITDIDFLMVAWGFDNIASKDVMNNETIQTPTELFNRLISCE